MEEHVAIVFRVLVVGMGRNPGTCQENDRLTLALDQRNAYGNC